MDRDIASRYMVSNMEQLLDSIRQLDDQLVNNPSFKFPGGETIPKRIKRGKNLVVYMVKDRDIEPRFLPSKTVGYRFSFWSRKDLLHVPASRDGRDGRKTTKGINSFMGDCYVNEELEKAFKRYCLRLGYEVGDAGKRPRKYWDLIIIDGDKVTADPFYRVPVPIENPNEYPEVSLRELKKELKRLSKLEQEVLIERKQRKFQENLRNFLLNERKSCEVTGIVTPELLVTSHIKPWARCKSAKAKLDPNNALLLSANFDKLFDQGLISFTDDGKILISDSTSKEERQKLGLSEELSLINGVPAKMKKYLKWHREHWFRK